jgi:hypothetical protein
VRVVRRRDEAILESFSSSWQSLTIFKRYGPEPIHLEATDTIGRMLTTLLRTLMGLLALIT